MTNPVYPTPYLAVSSRRLLAIYGVVSTAFRKVRLRRDPACPLCGDHPKITDLSGH